MRRRYERRDAREAGRPWTRLAVLGGIGLLALLWKEFPAMRRYYKMARM
ncbi:hypothetical protein [Actinomadura keratinilytica]|jgi:hypothetical protein|uniref:Uncharacterized protein n=1 Tax=Actinomadura keratinilytica TaxID=547461 RepID=A0ABP7ZET8_9ACTN